MAGSDAAMTRVSFQAASLNLDPALLRAPVELVDADLTPVGQVRLSASVDLRAGLYGARAVLPGGTELTAAFKVAADSDEVVVELKATAPPETTPPQQDIGLLPALARWSLPRLINFALSKIGRTDDAEGPATLRIFTGNPFRGPIEATSTVKARAGEMAAVPGATTQQFLEMPDASLQLAVPASPGDERRFQLRSAGRGAGLPHFIFDNEDLEVLLRFLGSGQLKQAREIVAIADSLPVDPSPEELERRPLASIVTGYIMLDAADPQSQMERSEALASRLAWSSDALIIRSEICARAGKHHEARKALLAIPDRGLPFFSLGVSCAASRLAQYCAADSGSDRADERTALTQLCSEMDWLARRYVPARPILTFRPPALPPASS